ncbi:MAG: DUF87 domain-containing protein [Ruminococcus sp.]|nr:DUF87 domain-containing protein [Ruminococcus sp.]
MKISGKTYLLKLEDFETPVIYMEICKHFSSKSSLNFIANLEYSKFVCFKDKNNPEWIPALEYLDDNGYAKNEPLTFFRNQAATFSTETTLFILMGAETALDRGSLKDFVHISMNDIVERLKKDYSIWFTDLLNDLSTDIEKSSNCINNIYKDLFRHLNTDAMQFSLFIDDLNNHDINTLDELVEHIYGSLQQFWGIPSIKSNIKKPTRKPLKYISNSYQFINNALTINSAKKSNLGKKLDKFAEDNGIDKSAQFEGFSDYLEFCTSLAEFIDNKNINENREKFMATDFGIVSNILDLNIDADPKPTKEKTYKVKGEPLTVYLKMLIYSWLQFKEKYGHAPLTTVITVTAIRLSNCTSSDNEDDTSLSTHFDNICTYMGGMLDYIRDKGLTNSNITVSYRDDIDPFCSENLDYIKSKLKTIDKWGVDSEIKFEILNVGESKDEKRKTEIKWSFSPYSNWKNAFSLLRHLCTNEQNGISPESPLLTTCSNMDELIASECEDEFFIKLESIKCRILPNYSNAVSKTFKECFANEFALLHQLFSKWTEDILKNGFFSSITSMNDLIINYTDLLETITKNYSGYTSAVQNKIGYILNIFNIISDSNFLDSAKSSEVIVPAYNPSMLEKIIARNDYIVFCFRDLINQLEALKFSAIENKFKDFGKLAAITQGVDMIPCGSDKLICRNVWGFYAIYYGENKKNSISNIELAPEENDSNADVSEQSNIILHHIMNYVRTFPSRIDGLNVSFISPTEIQYVVEGINKVTTELEKKRVNATIYLKVVCFGGSKNVSGYLKYWLNNYMNKERTVTLKTYLQYISRDKFESELSRLLHNQDICFIYDILQTETVKFDQYLINDKQKTENQVNCQFPMTFIPDTISSSHDYMRKVNISQLQFTVSKAYTQLTNKVMQPNAVDSQYKVMQVLELQSKQNTLLKIAHDNCRWVVCEDRAIDKELLNADDRRIIGFTTGEGCFGEYNVTVSARYDLIEDIKKMLKQRLIGKFTNWSMTRAEASAEYCVNLTESFDGSRILKALNPYDYEIHNFLAYALTVKILGIDQPANDKYVLRSLINLDNYQHWFKNNETRPDFMLIEIPNKNDIADTSKPLDISITIIECKMSVNVEEYYEEAFGQVSAALSSFSQYWNEHNNGIDRRYWFTQLYRAIVFSKLSLEDNDPKYMAINSKIYNILNGEFNIDWQGEVFAFDLKGENDNTEQSNDGTFDINVHTYGQISVQKMLLLREDGETVEFVEIDQNIDFNEEEKDYTEETEITQVASFSDSIGTHETLDTTITTVNDDASDKKSVSDVRILLGNDIKNGEKIYWEFGNKSLNNRHLLINGNSGCGKTYCIQGLLMSAVRQGISSVVFDYTGGFTNSKLDPVFKQELADRIEQRIVKAVKIPINPFKKGDIQIDEDIFIPEDDIDVANKIAEIMTSVYKFGDQQKSAVYSAVLKGMKTYGDNMSFQKLASELESIDTNYSKTVLSKIQPFIDMNPFAADDSFGWESIRDSEKSIVYVMQLAGYGRDVQVLLTELMLWDIWSFCTKTGDETKPFILVMDEAQNLDHGEKSPSAKILTEGRKFGISGWYATQFMKPQLSDDEIQRLQQSGQKLYFCPPDDGVDTVAKNLDTTLQGKKDWAARLKKLRKGECVTSGSMIKNNKWTVYPPKVIKVPSMQERLDNE